MYTYLWTYARAFLEPHKHAGSETLPILLADFK